MRFFPLIFLLFSSQAFSARVPFQSLQAVGKTFEVMGPNCFGTALKLSGFQSTFRGVDVGEFQAFVKLACQQVKSPEPGDIGVFEAPGFAVLHAYIYLSPELGLEKPGVDYLGKTPIAINSLESILYRNSASPECRRYSKDISECSNQHYYVRCSGLPKNNNSWLQDHERKVFALESLMGSLLQVSVFETAQVQSVREMQVRLEGLRLDLSKMPSEHLSLEWQAYLRARVQSLEKQLQYFQIKARL